MGNTSVKPHPRPRNKKQVHWKAAVRPGQPGKPRLVSETEITPDVITIRWDPPYRDGGSPITGYLVEHRRTGSPHWVRATPLLVSFPELTLSGLEPGWRYQFRVSAENAVGISVPSELSEALTVTLQRSAITSPRFTQELSDTVALENEKVEFVVHFLGQPAPKICWFKDGFEIFSSRRTRILTESDRSVLTIYQSALCDDGEIKCTATNKAGHASTKSKLTLQAPPSIRLPRQYEEGLLFEIGEVIRLKVSVAGLPTPLVFWTHNGETIKNDERYEIDNSDKFSTLRIGEAKRTDRGEYQIKAVNKLGQDVVSFLVTVTDKPSPPGKARVVMTLGKSVTLAWDTPQDDGGCKIGNYIIEYYRLGWDVWLKAATSRQLNTVLGDLIEGSEYKFRVKAESPYGVSEPSKESEIVFIPDPNRGINSPPTRSRSQPRDIPTKGQVPELPQRKPKPRSQSSTRVESDMANVRFSNIYSGIPVRPERTKIKSPPLTPEVSPRVIRRDLNTETFNKSIFDRTSMTRELTYGSPDINNQKNEMLSTNQSRSRSSSPLPNRQQITNTIQIIDNKREKSPSPMAKSRSPSPNTYNHRDRSPIHINDNKRAMKRNGNNFSGSTEFMLVLLPNGNKRQSVSETDINFEESLIPPPISLSAPELGTEPPSFEGLKYSASSTELLHERAMIRFYQAAEAEEAELKMRLEKKDSQERKHSIPKIQINSKDDEDIVGLQRKLSLRRRYSAGITAPQQVLWTQRRHSLRNSGDLTEIVENKLRKFPLSVDDKREIMMNRKRSESEEKEEQEFKKVRARMQENRPELTHKQSIDIVDLKKWEAEMGERENEYEESLSEEETESEEDERIYDQVPNVQLDEEDYTYHPGRVSKKASTLPKVNNEPFEILTKPNKLPDPNFIPKPILKRKSEQTKNLQTNDLQRKLSLETEKQINTEIDADLHFKRGSLPWNATLNTPSNKYSVTNSQVSNTGRRDSSPTITNQKPGLHHISAIASISGMAAASIVIPKTVLAKKKSDEEARVAADHYADIVRSYGKKGKKNDFESVYEKYKIQSSDKTENINDSHNESNVSSTHKDETVNKLNIDTVRNFDETNIRNRLDSESSSQRSSSPTKSKRILNRRGSPTVLNRDIFIRERDMSKNIKSKRTPSKSPGRDRSNRQRNPSPGRLRNTSESSSSNGYENWNSYKRKSPSPSHTAIKANFSTQTQVLPLRKSRSPSPFTKRAPKMKEIMTQTCTCIDTFISDTKAKMSAPFRSKRTRNEEQLQKYAEIKVRTTVDYITDLAMFIVACWLYLFSNELLAIPVLLVMVYRQLQEEVKKWIPKWIVPKPKER